MYSIGLWTHPDALLLKVTLRLDVSNVDQVKGHSQYFYDSLGRFSGKGTQAFATSAVHLNELYFIPAASIMDSPESYQERYNK